MDITNRILNFARTLKRIIECHSDFILFHSNRQNKKDMDLPKFLLADNSNFPDDIFVLHTEFPRFLINLKDDEIEWFEDLTGENEEDISTELADLMDKAGAFYDTEMKQFE